MNIKNYLDKLKANNKFNYFYLPFMVMMLTSSLVTLHYAVDSFWMYYEGMKPKLDMSYVQQQWLFNKFVAFIYSTVGWHNALYMQTGIMISIYLFLFFRSKNKVRTIIQLSLFSLCFYAAYTFRPWILSCAVMLVCYEYSKPKRTKYMLQLLIVMFSGLFIANIESALLPFLYILVGVRLFDNLIIDRNIKESLWSAVLMIAMILTSLMNPYGLSAVTYMFDGVGTAKNMGVTEMMPIKILSVDMLKIMFFSYIIFYKKRKLSTLGEKICVFVTTLLYFYMYRNIIFYGVATFMIMSQWVKNLDINLDDKVKKIEYNCFIIWIFLLLVCVTYCTQFNDFSQEYDIIVTDETCNWLKDNTDHNTNLYSHTIVNGFLECQGIKCTLADCRPELMEPDLANDWRLYTMEQSMKNTEMLLEKYDYDVLLVKPWLRLEDAYMYKLLESQPDVYHLVHKIEEDYPWKIHWTNRKVYEYIYIKVK